MSLCPELTLIKLIEYGTSEVTTESYSSNAERKSKGVTSFILLYNFDISYYTLLERGDF